MRNLRFFTSLAAMVVIAAGVVVEADSAEAPSGQWKLKLDGHTRVMYEGYDGIEFGLGTIKNDDWVHQRIQAMAILDHGDSLRIALELTWGKIWGKESSLAPPDQDEADFLQLYAQSRIPLGSDALEIRAGRQILYYGSGRLLASREGANQRLTHDALKVSWLHGADERVDFFVASPVNVEPEAFDNSSKPNEFLFWSVYGVKSLGKGHFVDLYYIGFCDRDSIFAEGGGTEWRHTIGARNWNKPGVFNYNTELILQFGEAAGREIIAGAASIEVTREIESAPFKLRLGLKADAISGGSDQGALHTFHPLFQANNYFNEGGFLAPSNLWNLNPFITASLRENVRVVVGANFQWLFSTRDSIYAPPLQRLAQPKPGGDRYLGTALNASIEWEFAQGASLFLGFTHQAAGGALKAIDGEDATYVQASLRFSF